MNLVRKYKIAKLFNRPLTDREMLIVTLTQKWLSDLIVDNKYDSKTNKLAFTCYYNSNAKLVLEIHHDSMKAYIRDDNCWRFLDDDYRLKYHEIKEILKFFIEQKLKCKLSILFIT